MRVNTGGAIEPTEVVGRDKQIALLWTILEWQSIVLSAERRMGKTSIIKKMQAEPVGPVLAFFRDLSHIQSPAEFVEWVAADLRALLAPQQKATTWFRQFWKDAGGTEVGGFLKIPAATSGNWKSILERTISGAIQHQQKEKKPHRLLFFWDEVPLMLDNIRRQGNASATMELLDTLRSLRQAHSEKSANGLHRFYRPAPYFDRLARG